MRLEGQAKAGFYPTPPEVARLIGSCLERNPQGVILDPCCGEGDTLKEISYYTGAFTHGIELEHGRAHQAGSKLDHVLHGDSLKAKAKGAYASLYVNPPYDQAEGERLELRFLWHWQRALMPGGTLVYIVPEVYLPLYAGTLTAHYEDVTVWRFPSEHYQAFKQVVVFGKKRAVPTQGATPLNVQGELERACARYPLPTPRETPELYLTGQDPERLEGELVEGGLSSMAEDDLMVSLAKSLVEGDPGSITSLSSAFSEDDDFVTALPDSNELPFDPLDALGLIGEEPAPASSLIDTPSSQPIVRVSFLEASMTLGKGKKKQVVHAGAGVLFPELMGTG